MTYSLSCKLISNLLQPLVFVLDTLTSASISTVCSSHLYAACWWWLCTFTVLLNHWYLAIVSLISQLFNTYIPEPHQEHFIMVMSLCKTHLIRFISFTTSILILFLCANFIIILFCFKFNFAHNIHCCLKCFWKLTVLYRVLNGKSM